MASEEHVVIMDLDDDPETWNTDPDFEPDMGDLSQESEAEDSEEPYSEPICNPSLHKKLQRQLMEDNLDRMAKKAQEKKNGKRAGYPIKFKYQILMKLKGKELKPSEACRRYKIPRQTLSDWRKNELAILKQVNSGQNIDRMKMVDSKYPELSHMLHLWLGELCSQSPYVRISGTMIKAKADKLVKMMRNAGLKGYDDWTSCSDGWVTRWKARCQVRYQRATGESNSADLGAVAQFRETTMEDILSRYLRHSFDFLRFFFFLRHSFDILPILQVQRL